MADSSWDWWFGDAPSKKRLSKNTIKRWLRSVGLRRWLLSLSIASSMPLIGLGDVRGDSPKGTVVVAPVSFGWASPSPLATMVAQDAQAESKTSEPKQDTANEDTTEEDTADEDSADEDSADEDSADEDERRRQRLRELLREDDGPDDKAMDEQSDAKKNRDDGEGNKDLFAEPFIEERLPEVTDGRFVLPPLRAVSIDQKPIGNGRVPDSLNAGEELTLVPLPEDAYARSGLSGSPAWPSMVRPWAAPNTYSHPLYFEDRMLERHGHERWGCLQPIASGARFFATVPMLPYLTTIQEPCETIYSKGYYRSGSAVSRFYQRPPVERRAIIVQSAATAAGFIALP